MAYDDVTDRRNFIWAHHHGFDEDAGVLWVKATGYEGGDEHWTGFREFPMDHPEYAFWVWIVSDPRHRILNDDRIAALKLEFASLVSPVDETIVFEPLPHDPA